jgi:hypothetical protein
METTLGKGGEIAESNYVEYPIVNTDSPPI